MSAGAPVGSRAGKQWDRLPREAADALYLDVLKDRLDGTQQPALAEGVLAHGRGDWKAAIFESPFLAYTAV